MSLAFMKRINPWLERGEIITYFTDVEGNFEFFQRFVKLSKVLTFDHDGQLTFRDTEGKSRAVFGGDACDKGPGDIRFIKQLTAFKRRFPERVTILLGNRDVNKMRLTSEVFSDEINSWPPGPWWDKSAPSPREFVADLLVKKGIAEKVEDITADTLDEHNTTRHRLEWIFAHTMGAAGFFEQRRRELSIISDCPIDEVGDDRVVQSFSDQVKPNGWFTEYLRQGQVAAVLGSTLFCHGGVAGNFGRKPPFRFYVGHVPYQSTKIDDVMQWVDGLNKWCQDQVGEWIAQPYWVQQGEERTRGGDMMQRYILSGICPCPMSGWGQLSMTNAPVMLEPAWEDVLVGAGIDRVVYGHVPHGACPTVVQSERVHTVMGDTSYSNMGAVDNRGAAVSEILILGNNTLAVHGCLADGTAVEYFVDHRQPSFIGRLLQDGRFVKAQTEDGRYLLSRVEGHTVSYDFVTAEEIASLPLVPFRSGETRKRPAASL